MRPKTLWKITYYYIENSQIWKKTIGIWEYSKEDAEKYFDKIIIYKKGEYRIDKIEGTGIQHEEIFDPNNPFKFNR